jgi:GTPase SAR1 family protein
LVYSLISNASLEAAKLLRMNIIRLKEDAQDFPMVLVGNKMDLKQPHAEKPGKKSFPIS